MKKSSTLLRAMLLILSIAFSTNMNSQLLIPQTNLQIEKCGSDQIHQQMMQTDPAYALKMQQYETFVQSFQSNANKTQSIIYKVPVVVNVMHKGEAIGMGSNVSEASIQNAIKLMNQMYRKEAGTVYNASGVDVEIEYILAVRDPSGNCTNGINRIDMSSNSAYMSNGVDRSSSGGISDAALKATYSWDQNLYYNIWLIYEIDNNEGGSGVQGYAYFASSHGAAQDGAVILASNFTSGTSTTAAHEIGHSLNLYHTFQGDGTGSSCPADVCGSSGDCCADTPPHKRSSSDCVSGTNSCDGGSSTDLFIHNYMDYSSDLCQNMLTANQKTRMTAAVSTTRASFLGSDNGGTNMGLVPVSTAGVDFESSASILCGTGQSVSFVDKSTCIPNSYLSTSSTTGISHLWTITNGVNTYTSTAQNPTITFNNTGTFNVTLQVTNAHGTTSATKTGMVVVSSAPTIPCSPTSTNEGNYAQTISNVTFNTINSSSSYLTNVEFTNLACSYNTIVTAGDTYQMSISANSGGSGAEVFEVYINYNNDSDFADAGELVFSGSAPNSTSGTYTTNITIPGTAVQNSLLRMRVIGETGSISATERTCGIAYFVGDVEDYGVYIQPAGCSAPTITGTTPASRCGTGTLSIGATASAGTVNWYTAATGGTAIATGTSFTTPSLTTTTTYYVDATNAGCTTASRTSVTASVTPTAVPSIVIALTSGTNPKCSGTTSTFTATPTNGGTTPSYQWKVNGSNVGTNSTTYTTSTITNGQAVTCVLTSNATCAAPTTATSSAVTMTVNTAVTPSVAIALTSGTNPKCSGTTSTFTATPTNGGGAPSYQWKVNGSNVGTNSTTYTTSTITSGQAVTCVLTSNATCAAPTTATSSAVTMTVNTTVVPSVAIALTSGTNPKCSGTTSTFTATPTNGGTTPSYQWKVNGSNVGTNSTTYTTSTITNGQAVTCVLTSNATCAAPTTTTSSAVTMTVNTTVVPSVAIALTSGSNPSCSGSSVTFTATPTNGGTTPNYQWQVDGTNAGTNSSSFTSSSLNNGEIVTCILTSNAVCATTPTATSSAVTMTVSGTVAPSISIAISSGSNPMCVSASTTFSATPTNGGSAPDYQWQIDGTNAGTNASSFTTSSLNNGENVTCILTSNSSCASTPTAVSSVITVTTSSPPTVNATASSTNICSGSTTTLTASGATTYLWNTGATTSAISVSPTTNTTYTVTGTTLGCSNTDMITITVNALPVVNIAGTNTLCTGTSSVLTASGGLTYLWNTSETTTSINVSPGSFTTYTVTGIDANGCSASDTHSVNPISCSGETATTSLYMCNLNISDKNYPVWANPVTGAQYYRFSFYNPAAPTVTVASLTSPTRSININAVSGLYNGNVYKWTVAVNKGIGFGPESSGTCTLNIKAPNPTVPCGKVVANLATPILCATFNGVSNYKFTLYNDATDALVAVKTQTSNYLYLNQVPGIAYGNTYKITVQAEYNNGSGLVYSAPSSSLCTVTTSAPMAVLPCGNTYSNTTNPYTGITAVTGASAYKVNCYNVSTSALVGTKTFTNNYIYIKQIPGMVYNTSYYWTVQCQYNNGTGLVFGPESNNTCMMTWGAAVPMIINQGGDIERLMSNQEDMDEHQPVITVYPNPNNGSFNVATNKNMSINIVNEFGQIVRTQSLNQDNNYEINIKDLANGIYFLIGQTQDNNVLRQKIIVNQ